MLPPHRRPANAQKRIKLAFMRRLTHHLHAAYTSHHAYYSASTLGGAQGTGPQQLSAETRHSSLHQTLGFACLLWLL